MKAGLHADVYQSLTCEVLNQHGYQLLKSLRQMPATRCLAWFTVNSQRKAVRKKKDIIYFLKSNALFPNLFGLGLHLLLWLPSPGQK